MHYYRFLFVFLLVSASSACAPIRSQSLVDRTGQLTGIVYSLPKRDLIVEYTVAGTEPTCQRSLNVGTSDAYADPSATYLAELPVNFWGSNKSGIVISPTGLLASAGSTAKSRVSDFVVAAAHSATLGHLGPDFAVSHDGFVNDADTVAYYECIPTEKVWNIPVPMPSGSIGNGLTVYHLDHDAWNLAYEASDGRWTLTVRRPPISLTTDSALPTPSIASGLYHRANLPYEIRLDTRTQVAAGPNAWVAMLPNESPALLVATPPSVFGAKHTELHFDDGVLVGYAVDHVGDGAEAAALPIKVLGGVGAAVGQVFSFRRQRASDEALTIEAEMALLRAKRNACVQALSSDEEETIRVACGP